MLNAFLDLFIQDQTFWKRIPLLTLLSLRIGFLFTPFDVQNIEFELNDPENYLYGSELFKRRVEPQYMSPNNNEEITTSSPHPSKLVSVKKEMDQHENIRKEHIIKYDELKLTEENQCIGEGEFLMNKLSYVISGAFGKVFFGEYRYTPVAIKMILESKLDKKAVNELLEEAQVIIHEYN